MNAAPAGLAGGVPLKRCAGRKSSSAPRSLLRSFCLSGRSLLHQAVLTTLFCLLPSSRKTPTFPGIHSDAYATHSLFLETGVMKYSEL